MCNEDEGKGSTTDIQSSEAPERIPLGRVGVNDLEYPVCIRHNGAERHVIMNIRMDVDLPEEQRGAHMSRFIERLEEDLSIPSVVHSIEELAESLARHQLSIHTYARRARVELSTRIDHVDGKIFDLYGRFDTARGTRSLGVRTVGAIACPCSIALTGGLSHNQRASLQVMIDLDDERIEAEDLVAICEESFSVPVLLKVKRPQEKEMVERMHANPRFVEDVVRRCVSLLRERYAGLEAHVLCISHESIHPYDVFAEWKGRL